VILGVAAVEAVMGRLEFIITKQNEISGLDCSVVEFDIQDGEFVQTVRSSRVALQNFILDNGWKTYRELKEEALLMIVSSQERGVSQKAH
jgi:hypothetical protein